MCRDPRNPRKTAAPSAGRTARQDGRSWPVNSATRPPEPTPRRPRAGAGGRAPLAGAKWPQPGAPGPRASLRVPLGAVPRAAASRLEGRAPPGDAAPARQEGLPGGLGGERRGALLEPRPLALRLGSRARWRSRGGDAAEQPRELPRGGPAAQRAEGHRRGRRRGRARGPRQRRGEWRARRWSPGSLRRLRRGGPRDDVLEAMERRVEGTAGGLVASPCATCAGCECAKHVEVHRRHGFGKAGTLNAQSHKLTTTHSKTTSGQLT